MKNIDCEEACLLMCPEIDGELEVANTVSLTKHMNTCTSCSENFELLVSVSRRVHGYADQLSVPVDLEKNVHAALNKFQSDAKTGQLLRLLSIAAVAIVALGLLTLTIFRPAPSSAETVESLVAETGHAANYKGQSSFKTLSSNHPKPADMKGDKPFGAKFMPQFKVAVVENLEGPQHQRITRTCFLLLGSKDVCVDRYEMPLGLLPIKIAGKEALGNRQAKFETVGSQNVICTEEAGQEVVYASAAPKDALRAWLERKV